MAHLYFTAPMPPKYISFTYIMKIIVKNKIRPEVQIFYESLFLLYVEKYNLIIRNGKILTIMCSVNLVFKLKKYI